ncbi:MAG: 2-phospho-L-lactate transferase CofD family protein, partial [Desulfohalobiaceae bacterium]
MELPNKVQIERCRAAPHLGPKILFFSGGNALKGLSQALIRYTHNSVHIITPFDSGGSSAELRKAFNMPAVGDIRNRLMALADQSITGNPATYSLFSYRLPRQE